MDGSHVLAFFLGLVAALLALVAGLLVTRLRAPGRKADSEGQLKGCWTGQEDAERGEAGFAMPGKKVAAEAPAAATLPCEAADRPAQEPDKDAAAAAKARKGSLRDSAAVEEDASTTMSSALRPISAETDNSGSTGQNTVRSGESGGPPESLLPGSVREPPPPAKSPAPKPPPPLANPEGLVTTDAPSPPPLLAHEGGLAPGPLPLQAPAPEGPPPPPARLEPKRDLHFGPTDHQRTLPDPPEPQRGQVPEEAEELGYETSLSTVQRALGKRDAQTTDLHRQLRELRQMLFHETAEARSANGKLQALLADPSKAPAEQAVELRRLQQETSDLSGRLTETKQRERHWLNIARQQRLYLMHSEHFQQQEEANVLKKHPAGEVFIAVQPVIDEDDLAHPNRGIAQSHCDPYSVDSWPFEPNAMASRNNFEPGFQELEEEDDELYDDEGDDAGAGVGTHDNVFEDDEASLEGIEGEGADWATGPAVAPRALEPSGGRPDTARSL